MAARRSFCLAAACLALGLARVEPTRAAQHEGLAEAVKATYLPKFAPFVTWPPASFASPHAPYSVCVAGEPEFEALVRRAAAGQVVGGRQLEVHSPASVEQAATCHILYLGPGSFAPATSILAALRGRPVLTVTDGASEDSAGVINFVLVSGRVRFEIDARLAERNGISISSRVLELAVRVRRAELGGTAPVPA